MNGWTLGKTVELINDYRNSPELWNFNLEIYKDNRLKVETLEKISAKFDTSVKDLKSKIKNLRTLFRKQHKKIQLFKSADPQAKYHKRLWFGYKHLKFLLEVDADNAKNAAINEESYDESEEDLIESVVPKVECVEHVEWPAPVECHPDVFGMEYHPDMEQNHFPAVEISEGPSTNHGNRKNIKRSGFHLPAIRDEFSVYGEYVANELRKLSTRAQIMTKHNINNVLFEANIGNYDLPSAD